MVFYYLFNLLLLPLLLLDKIAERDYARRQAKSSDVEPTPLPMPAPGAIGVVRTSLRPVGKVRIDGKTHQARADVGHLDAGVEIVVTGSYSGELIVREHTVKPADEPETAA